MADVTIETACNANSGHLLNVAQVWTSSTVGYDFYIDNAIDLVYKKTTDSGATWAAKVSVRAGTLARAAVWYDKWTPGDTGTLVHITYTDSATDIVYYRSLDTSSDTLGTERTIFTGATLSAAATLWDEVCVTIAKARGGNLLVIFDGDAGTEVGNYRSTDGGVNWVSKSTTGLSLNLAGWFLVLPANTSDSQDMLLVSYHSGTTTLDALIYDDSGDSWGSTTIDAAVVLSNPYFQMAASVRAADNHVILVYWNLTDNALADLKAVDLNPSTVGASGTSITTLTDVIANTAEYSQCCIFIDQNTADLYVGYLGGSTWEVDAHVFYKKSTDDGSTWGSETQLDATLDDQRALWCDLGGTTSRFEPFWYNTDLDDLVTNVDNSIAITPPAAGTRDLLLLMGVS